MAVTVVMVVTMGELGDGSDDGGVDGGADGRDDGSHGDGRMRMRVTLIETALTEYFWLGNVLKVSCSPSRSILIFYSI